MSKQSTPSIVINVVGPFPVRVNTDTDITVNWSSPDSAGDGYLNLMVEDAGGLTAYPIGVIAPNSSVTVSHHCYRTGTNKVTVRERSLKGNASRFVDLGALVTFTVVA